MTPRTVATSDHNLAKKMKSPAGSVEIYAVKFCILLFQQAQA
jgi:hypothetical protein